MSLGSFGTATYRTYRDHVVATIPYFRTKMRFAIPTGRPISSIEKLMLPFKYIIWTCCGVAFACGVLVVVVLRWCLPAHMRAFVIGRRNRYPLLSMWTVWLGNSTVYEPGRNFARYLLMLWTILALVIRTSYQGALFDILRTHRNTKPLDTFRQIHQAKYTIYVSQRMSEYVRAFDVKVQPHIAITPTPDIDQFIPQMGEQAFNGVLVVTETAIRYYNKQHVKARRRILMAKEVVYNNLNVIYVQRRSCLLEAFDKELWRYQSGGLISAWAAKFLQSDYEEERVTGSSSLEYGALAEIFFVYAIAMAHCFAVLLLEIVHGCLFKDRR